MRLKWETTHQLDIGVDMGFFNDRIRLMADYYNKKTTDLLFSVTLPDTSGYGSARQNVGSVRFYGAEVELSTVNIQSKNFTWTTDFTYSFNMNKVLSLPDEYRYKDVDGKDAWRIGGYTMSETGFRFGGTAVGERMGRIYGYKTAYIIETEAQADAALYDVNSHGIRRSDGRSIAGRKDIGDYEWLNRAGSARTADGSEQINDEDMFLLGYVTPHSTGGMNNTFKYRNLSLSVSSTMRWGTRSTTTCIRAACKPRWATATGTSSTMRTTAGRSRATTPSWRACRPTTPMAATRTIRASRTSTCRRAITSACAT